MSSLVFVFVFVFVFRLTTRSIKIIVVHEKARMSSKCAIVHPRLPQPVKYFVFVFVCALYVFINFIVVQAKAGSRCAIVHPRLPQPVKIFTEILATWRKVEIVNWIVGIGER